MGLIHCSNFVPILSPEYPRFLYQFGDSKLEDERRYQTL